jgi:hypothetical protein
MYTKKEMKNKVYVIQWLAETEIGVWNIFPYLVIGI